jgi:hypothetical protein
VQSLRVRVHRIDHGLLVDLHVVRVDVEDEQGIDDVWKILDEHEGKE